MRRGVLLIGALALVAMVATIAAQEPGADSPAPRVTNPGPRGLAVLETWLREAGVPVVAHAGPLTELPAGTGVVVLSAPSAREVRPEEVKALEAFVQAGGTLIYLVPRAQPQPALNAWLDVRPGPVPPLVASPGLDDVGGTTVNVTLAAGLLAGAKRLRLSAGASVHVGADGAVPVTSPEVVWWLQRGRGEIWVTAGPELAQNARLELEDNALFWSHLAGRGPVVFDELHHQQEQAALPVNLVVTGLQLAFLAALFVWARGARLGPPRDDPATQHRSAREYVEAMARLTESANVEPELVAELKRDFRRTLQEQHGVPLSWSWDEVDAELSRRGVMARGAVLELARETDLLKASQSPVPPERSRGP